jgi:hypothetical protein
MADNEKLTGTTPESVLTDEAAQMKPTAEQLLYAKILEIGMYIGLGILFVTYAIYIFGIAESYIPLDEVSQYWQMPVHQYLEEANIETGWSWLSMVGYGDFMNFIGIAILAGVSIFCYLAIVPTLLKNNDNIYAVLAILEVIILSAAASGLIQAGH